MEGTVDKTPPKVDGPARVLFIHCEDEQRRQVAACLTSAGFQVSEATCGIEAIERAIATRPDLVLLDLHLPDMEGAEIASRLRSAGLSQTPIVSIGRARTERGMALSVGCDGAVCSPPDLAKLPNELREFLAGKRERLRTGEEKRYLKEFSQNLVEKLEAKVRELTVANERLRQFDTFKSEFMTAISHELSTPLTPIVGYLKLLAAGKLGPLEERQGKAVEAMLHSADRLARTIDNLSDFAALSSGEHHVRQDNVDPRALAQRVVDDLAELAKRKRLVVRVSGQAVLPALLADEHRLEQALANVVDNAIKFSPHGGHVLVDLTVACDRLRIAVYDQGPGLSPAAQESIFEPIRKAAGATVPSAVVSMGLGLPVTRKIIEAHKGRLCVESPPQVMPEGNILFSGAKFTIELPLLAAGALVN